MVDDILIRDVKTNKIIHVARDSTVMDAAKIMKQYDISSLIVLEKSSISGIVTERDIVRKIVCAGADPNKALVSDIMTAHVESIDGDETIVDAARKMRDKKVKKLLVTEGREVKGIISERDILEMDPVLHRPT
jgi:CBS domain-containing protein